MVLKSNEISITVDKEGFPELVEELKKVFDSNKKPTLMDLSGGQRWLKDKEDYTYVLTLTIKY